jgi:hypothetical protein
MPAFNHFWMRRIMRGSLIRFWFHLSTVLDDFSRFIIAWKLRAATASGRDRASRAESGAEHGLSGTSKCISGALRNIPDLIMELPRAFVTFEMANLLVE